MRENDLIRCYFDGRALIPDGNFAVAAINDRLGEGQVVNVDLDPERSGKSHRHQFAFVRTAWENLPERLLSEPYAASAEHLRKHGLIVNGFCHTEMVAVGSSRRAERVAASLSRVAARFHGYAITTVEGNVAYCFTPESQSMKAMGGERFQASKQALLEWCAGLLDVSADDLANMGRKEAA